MNATHIHLFLNHIPLISAAVAILLIAIGVVKKSAELKKASLWIFVVAALITIPVYLTGEPADGIIDHRGGLDGLDRQFGRPDKAHGDSVGRHCRFNLNWGRRGRRTPSGAEKREEGRRRVRLQSSAVTGHLSL